MTTSPSYGHIHDHNDKCRIKGGRANGSFVFYENENHNYESYIVTLGGSTTDGFYNHINDGYTWPFYLNQLTSKYYNIGVINGGVGGFNSNQELKRLLYDVRKINYKKKLIISLNGINEFLFSGDKSYWEWQLKNFPFSNANILKMLNNEEWLIQNRDFTVLPSTLSIIQSLRGKNNVHLNLKSNLKKALITNPIKHYDEADIWYENVKLMKGIASALNAKYIVFLQPTMGLKNISDEAPAGTNDAKLLNSINDNYVIELNKFYSKSKQYCKTLEFCFNISETVKPNGNMYNDIRHHNRLGNKKLSEVIFTILKEKSFLEN